MPRYLTKSRFKQGLECPIKLFYTNKKEEYIDSRLDDSFLEALAEGGFQVDELAKCYFQGGTNIEELDHALAIEQTEKLLMQENVIIYEPAFRFENLFIRADIVVKNGQNLQVFEVKAKSFDHAKDNFLGAKGFINAKWKPYLYDIAFQKWVISKSHSSFKVSAYLFLCDKTKLTSVEGLNQKFFLYREQGRTRVKVVGPVDQSSLGEQILTAFPVDEIIDKIYAGTDQNAKSDLSFEERVALFSEGYASDKKVPGQIGSHCDKCEFKAEKPQTDSGLKSGFHECWTEQAGFSTADFEKKSVLDIWNFLKKDEYIRKGIYFQEQIKQADLEPKKPAAETGKPGLTRLQRQVLQVTKASEKEAVDFLDTKGLGAEMDRWKFPLHFIDFETTAVAIPFNKLRRPYEQIAFQFSHHQVNADGTILHNGQWINTEPGYFPNYDFVRALKKELSFDQGTIFRYATHEDTILNAIYGQLQDSREPDKDELCHWIKTITHAKKGSVEQWEGERDMVDLREMVLRYFYSSMTNGSNSIKQVLPAVLQSSSYLKEKYGRPVYGVQMKSLNFYGHQWISILPDGSVLNPYNTLPKIHEGYANELFDEMIVDEESGIYDGGAAMVAYAKMQFTQMSKTERERITSSLLRYCELDTLAMVMIWEAWSQNCKTA